MRRGSLFAAPAFALALAAAASSQAASLSLDRGPIVLGRTESVGVTLRVDEAPGAEERPLRLAVNVGAFAGVERVGPGVYRSVYIPPVTRFPQVALVALWRETGPRAPIDFLRIPLSGTTEVPVGVRPGTEVRLRVGLLEFGPQVAGRSGRVRILADVPPGLGEATILARSLRGAESERAVPIRVPGYNRLTAALVPHALVADGRSWARLVVFYDLGGAEVPASRVRVEASAGEVVFVEADRGRYVYRYLPPAGREADGVSFAVRVDGDPLARAAAQLALRLPPPSRLVLQPPAAPLPADGRSRAEVRLLVTDAHGLGLPAQPVELRANGVPVPVEELGAGVYVGRMVAPARYPRGGLVRLEAAVPGAAERVGDAAHYQLLPARVPAELTALFSPEPVPADGRTPAALTLEVRDAAGMPLERAELIVLASHGALGPLTHEGRGRYRAEYVPPAEPPPGAVLVQVLGDDGGFERRLRVPLRAAPGRLVAGIRAGLVRPLQGSLGARLGVDLAAPLFVGGRLLSLGLSASAGRVSQTLLADDGVLWSESEALFFPVAARGAIELWAGPRLSVTAGLGAGASLARMTSSLVADVRHGWGPVVEGHAGAALWLGAGQLFAELGWGWAPVRAPGFRLDAGGAGLTLGYRFRVLR